jgi:hypothetical protein
LFPKATQQVDVIRNTADDNRWTILFVADPSKVRMDSFAKHRILQKRHSIFGGEHDMDVDLHK